VSDGASLPVNGVAIQALRIPAGWRRTSATPARRGGPPSGLLRNCPLRSGPRPPSWP